MYKPDLHPSVSNPSASWSSLAHIDSDAKRGGAGQKFVMNAAGRPRRHWDPSAAHQLSGDRRCRRGREKNPKQSDKIKEEEKRGETYIQSSTQKTSFLGTFPASWCGSLGGKDWTKAGVSAGCGGRGGGSGYLNPRFGRSGSGRDTGLEAAGGDGRRDGQVPPRPRLATPLPVGE